MPKNALPGGCLIGARPVNYHLSALEKLGMNYEIKDGYILAKSFGKLKGGLIRFPKITVGATENSIIAACLAKGKTVLRNCAVEPEIKDLTNFLNSAGAKINWKGRTCTINGVSSLNSTNYSVMADRIEAGTFCVAATLAKGNLEINNLDPKIINTELNLLKKTGAKIKVSKNKIHINGPEKIKSIKNIKTKEFPGIPTDLQAQLMVLMCKAKGKSSITENIFENRFMHVAELQRLGANITTKNNKAYIEGNTKFIGAEVMSSDLRASVALVLAASVAQGRSVINRIYHLDRGYEKIENKLISTLISFIKNKYINLSLLSDLLSIPTFAEIETEIENIDPLKIYKTIDELNHLFGTKLKEELHFKLQEIEKNLDKVWPEGKNERKLIETIWKLS